MRYSIQPRERRYVKDYGFLTFAKKIDKKLSNKYDQKLLDSAKNTWNRCIKNCYQKSNSKKAEVTGNLVGNKVADKITSISKKYPDHSTELQSNEANNEMPKERYISPKERQQIVDELRLI